MLALFFLETPLYSPSRLYLSVWQREALIF